MSHFTEGVLQAYLDEEDVAGARAQIGAHVSECVDCAARLQDLRESSTLLSTALRSLDVPPLPMAALAELRLRGQQRDWVERMRGARRPLIRAAILIVGVMAATVPGSPVRGWLVEAWNALARTEEPAVSEGAPKQVPEAVPETTGGFGTMPQGGRVRILLQRATREMQVRVVLVEAEGARVQLLGGVSPLRGRAEQGLIEVDGTGSREILVLLPRSLTLGTVEIDGRVYVISEGNQLRYEGPGTPETRASEVIFRPSR
jgi:hypothetical protein